MRRRKAQNRINLMTENLGSGQLFIGTPGGGFTPLGEVTRSEITHRHEIVRCTCGAVIAQCRCPGPKPERTITGGCDDCRKGRVN